ncbi:4-hydroxythreonine-4-phosphate dehydrogenase [Helicobacter sp.]|uniref:4-hydroxythreonine-4-phosphate dehydrogenase n=1 Tax=Helicobacter sp. TaxID=218 RepID=UPI0025C6907E|nr:4-hydroxythreonine-4-phosphate dehydrogenase [Helicobacter sp.]MCI5969495.1 4-hydroxythreonine-4-phosphate dehydrogenase [Helicobacter sp.]MDY2584184.1 4-hydroxythreonine-4-phosphate dehydrogenase [Helicobacter sp.]
MKIAISIGDPNGVGLEILLKSHKKICKFCNPVYCVDKGLLKRAARILNLKLPKDLKCISLERRIPKIVPGDINKESGAYAYASFLQALNLTLEGKTKALVTLPIHKKAWQLAGISYVGHTEALREVCKFDKLESKKLESKKRFQSQKAIMMLGSPKLYIALFSDHIPLKEVPLLINLESLKEFLLNLAPHILKTPCGVLGLNPHAGDFGVLGDEDVVIKEAIKLANASLGKEVFIGPLVPDTAFIGKHLRYYVAMYHDQGLIPLKTLYFKESINITLNLPIIRTSVDHGTAFDIAYKNKAESKSYVNAIKEAILRVKSQALVR